jgi:hypothetical protein
LTVSAPAVTVSVSVINIDRVIASAAVDGRLHVIHHHSSDDPISLPVIAEDHVVRPGAVA